MNDLRKREASLVGSHEHTCLVRFVFMDVLQRDLDECRERWNTHTIRPVKQSCCPSGKPDVMYYLSHRFVSRRYVLNKKKKTNKKNKHYQINMHSSYCVKMQLNSAACWVAFKIFSKTMNTQSCINIMSTITLTISTSLQCDRKLFISTLQVQVLHHHYYSWLQH